MPWDVLHLSLAARMHWTFGGAVIAVGILVLAAWFPLRVKPGPGTIVVIVIPGVVSDGVLAALPVPPSPELQAAYLAAGIAAFVGGTAAYLRAGFGPGPRDGLMVALSQRGFPTRWARIALDGGALVLGLVISMLGPTVDVGGVGWGTLVATVAVGGAMPHLRPRSAPA
jgi:uncharacterized membrane protein YczE